MRRLHMSRAKSLFIKMENIRPASSNTSLLDEHCKHIENRQGIYPRRLKKIALCCVSLVSFPYVPQCNAGGTQEPAYDWGSRCFLTGLRQCALRCVRFRNRVSIAIHICISGVCLVVGIVVRLSILVALYKRVPSNA